MSRGYYSRFAERVFPIRWWLAALSVFGFALVILVAALPGRLGLQIATVVAGPLIGLPWAALCAALWFHPVHGSMLRRDSMVGRLPMPLQVGIRWYASAFLTILLLVCGVGWPVFALTAN